jgi:hypothetical protein
VSLVEIRGLRGGGLTSKVGWNWGDGDINGESGGFGGGGGFEAEGDVGGAAEWELGEEVGGFHEGVEFAVDGPGQGAEGGNDGVEGVADGVVEGSFAVFAGEKVVAVVVAGFVAVAAGGGGAGEGEDGQPVFALEEEGVHGVWEAAIRVSAGDGVEGKAGGGGKEGGQGGLEVVWSGVDGRCDVGALVVLVNFALQAAEGGVGNKGGGGGEGGSGMEEIEGGEEGGKEVAESANEVSRIALGGPGSEVAGVDGRESADEVAERDASGGHADGAGEGDEEGGGCGFGVVAEAGAAEADWAVSQEQGESREFVRGVAEVLEEGGGGGKDLGGEGGLPGGERGRGGGVGVVQDVSRKQVGEGGECAEFEEGGRSLFVGDTSNEAACLAFKGGGGGGEEGVDKIGGAEGGAQEAGAVDDLRAGAVEFGKCEVEVMELGWGEMGVGWLCGGGGEDLGLGAVEADAKRWAEFFEILEEWREVFIGLEKEGVVNEGGGGGL